MLHLIPESCGDESVLELIYLNLDSRIIIILIFYHSAFPVRKRIFLMRWAGHSGTCHVILTLRRVKQDGQITWAS